jgi:S1-C subfamily serine protease
MDVEDGSPALTAGVVAGDIIVSFAGEAVSTIDALHRRLTHERIGMPTEMGVLRGTERRVLIVTPAESQARAAA